MHPRAASLLVLLLSSSLVTAVAAEASPRRVENFNRDWKFTRGAQAGAEPVAFNDANWQAVRLPHDWAIGGPYEPEGDPPKGGGTAKTQRREGADR